MTVQYAALGPNGDVLGVESTVEAAIDLARELAPGTEISVQHIEPLSTGNPAIGAAQMPELALKLSRLPRVSAREVSALTVKQAHARLLPYFAGILKRGVEVAAYDQPAKMAESWIGQNAKTEKAHPIGATEVMGLTLIPADHAYLAPNAEGPYSKLWDPAPKEERDRARLAELARDRRYLLPRWREEAGRIATDKRFTLCAGSSQDCRDSCLVFAGQNAAERYNTYRKIAQAYALLGDPVAFLRMLIEAIEKWHRSPLIARDGFTPYFRMNVLSDIPWELVCDWLFEDVFSELQFYDYTKVPGRITPDNYDLTFSVSGTPTNIEYAQSEINELDRRIAVVFVGYRRRGETWRQVPKAKAEVYQATLPLPHEFWGLPVIDGDVSDVRPLDPAPSCVGLRWKTPSGKRAGSTIDLQRSSFVTPVYVVSEDMPSRFSRQVGAGGEIPWWRGGQKPNPAGDQWLIAAVTPRYQPIGQPMSQPA